MNILAKFLRLSRGDQVLIVQSGILLAAIRLGLKLLPFRVVRQIIARSGQSASRRPTRLPAERIAWSVHAASRYLPYLHATCLPQALTAYILLRHHGYVADLRIGVQYAQENAFSAHAWVEYQGRVMIGALPDLHRYTVLPDILPTRT